MKTRVLIVDDRPTNLRIYAQFVSMMGDDFVAATFANPLEALDWLKENTPDLLVVDYRMPQMNGAEFVKKVRAKHLGGDVPAIVITAHQDRQCRLAALDAGATDFLQSPVSHQEFQNRAKALLEHKKRKEDIETRVSKIGRLVEESVTTDGSVAQSRKTMLEQIIDTIPIMINATDRNGHCLFTNAYQAALFNKIPDELVGQNLYGLLGEGRTEIEIKRNETVLNSGAPIPHYEEKITSDGVELIFHCNKSPLMNHKGNPIGVLTTAVDITARKFAEEHRTHLALHDMLTGLPNRTLLAERLSKTVDACKETDQKAALLLLDLDRFKIINDTRGHQIGDTLLREVAERIISSIGPNDFAARIGGDEFAIILQDINHVDEINAKCTNLLHAINQSYSISGVDQVIGASIGVSLIPDDGEDHDELLRLSDLAMYEAKGRGRNIHCFYSTDLNRIAQANAQLELELREALNGNQFTLDYQPIIDAGTLEYVGLEALIRWNHPTRGLLLPDQFIRVADDCGLMDLVGKWVINEVCRQFVELEEQEVFIPRIAINISPRQFQNQDIFEELVSKIREYDIDPTKIVIEITEELLLEQNEQTTATLNKLRDIGIGISIDDFGTGYSSLQYLRDLPANRLKIDRAFVSRIETSNADRAIISTIAHLAHALDMRVVAEGVENNAQFDLLRAAGCDEIQGFEIARPLPAEELVKIFGRDRKPVQLSASE